MAEIDPAQAEPAGEWRRDAALGDAGVDLLHRGLGLCHLGNTLVQYLARFGAARLELARTVELQPRELGPGRGRRPVGAFGRVVELDQRRAGRDIGAGLEADRDDAAGNLRCQRHFADRHQRADRLDRLRQGGGLDDERGDVHRRRRIAADGRREAGIAPGHDTEKGRGQRAGRHHQRDEAPRTAGGRRNGERL